jgi:glycosyltransferase involved in cell wall biosynthesis
MKILIGHNQYQQPGGEDQSVAAEIAMLEAFGNQVIQYHVHNDSIKTMSSVGVAMRTVWNRRSYRDLRGIIQKYRPDVVHFNNTFPLISPAVYYAARAEGVPVIQTLRNYRLMCPGAYFLRDNHVCTMCMGKSVAWPSVIYGCYRQSRSASAVVATMLGIHGLLKTWKKTVDTYIALTEFSRKIFIAGGFPEEKIVVKPNFVFPDDGPGPGKGRYAVFIGRLSDEKGIQTMVDAWRLVQKDVPLRIVGGGPLEALVRQACDQDSRISYLGPQPASQVAKLLGDASFLVFPSLWYEGMPRTIIEAFAQGTPVISSKLGAMQEMIQQHQTGLHFEAGDSATLAKLVDGVWDDHPTLTGMRETARGEFRLKYSYESNYDRLMDIYGQAISRSRIA